MSGYIGTQPVPQATQTRETFTATAGQTTFNTGGYTAGYIDVYLNGVKLVSGTDYTATNGSDVVLLTGASAGDTLETVAYTAFTVADQTFTGNIVMADGLTVDNDGATVLTVDRATSDGTIIDVQRGGTSVGSIGSHAGFVTMGSGDTSLIFDSTSNTIEPFNQNDRTSEDAAITLGWSSNRFKDLYLSGGVYLGGTGSANYLDDYEVGIFSSSTTANNVTSYGTFTGRYMKVGSMVHITAKLDNIYAGTGHRYFVFNAPFPQYANSNICVGTCTNYPSGDRRSGIVINNSGGEPYGFYVSWNNIGSQNGGGVSLSITYETT